MTFLYEMFNLSCNSNCGFQIKVQSWSSTSNVRVNVKSLSTDSFNTSHQSRLEACEKLLVMSFVDSVFSRHWWTKGCHRFLPLHPGCPGLIHGSMFAPLSLSLRILYKCQAETFLGQCPSLLITWDFCVCVSVFACVSLSTHFSIDIAEGVPCWYTFWRTLRNVTQTLDSTTWLAAVNQLAQSHIFTQAKVDG